MVSVKGINVRYVSLCQRGGFVLKAEMQLQVGSTTLICSANHNMGDL